MRLSLRDLLVATSLYLLVAVPSAVAEQQIASSALAALSADLTAATTVYQGVVTSSTPSNVAGVITTEAVLQRTAVLKGSAPSQITVTTDGGSVAGLTLEVGELPVLSNGNRVIILLDANGDPMPGIYLYRLHAQNDNVENTPNLTLNTFRSLLQ